MSVPFMFVDGNLTLVINNKTYQVLPDHINYKLILEALPTATAEELLEIVDVEKAVASFSDGLVEVKNGQVTYEGEVVHGSIGKRILEFMSKGLPFEPLVNFLDNLMQNPSMQSQKELYDFLEHEICRLLRTAVSWHIRLFDQTLRISMLVYWIIVLVMLCE